MGNVMLRGFPTTDEQRLWDQEQRLDDLCRPLASIDPDLVEWTLRPARDAEKLIAAEFFVRDWRDPLGHIAQRLRAIADAIDRLRRPPGGCMSKAA